jgi:nifR3 family TIM-barrel protein
MQNEQKLGGQAWAIGSLALSGRAVLAPLSGVTDVVFRRIAKRFGAALVVSEMVASDEFVLGSEETRLRAEGEGITPHVIQLAGCDPRWMGEAARLAEASGAAVIDINMGCPAKRVTGGYAGSALMRDLDNATRIIEATVAAVSCPVTVKMRLGWDRDTVNAPELARRAASIGAAAATVHGRTRQQFYKGAADWAAIRQVAESVAIPVVANGDIGSTEQARCCLAASRATAVMVGREAVGRPWLVGQIAADLDGRAAVEPSSHDKAAVAIEHYQGILGLYGRGIGLRHARKHLAAYADDARRCGFGLGADERTRLVTSEDPAEVARLLVSMFAERRRAGSDNLAEAA